MFHYKKGLFWGTNLMILLVMANDEVLASTTKDSRGAMRDNTNPVYIHRPMMPRPIVHKLSSHEFFEVSVLNVYNSEFFVRGLQISVSFACYSPFAHLQ